MRRSGIAIPVLAILAGSAIVLANAGTAKAWGLGFEFSFGGPYYPGPYYGAPYYGPYYGYGGPYYGPYYGGYYILPRPYYYHPPVYYYGYHRRHHHHDWDDD